MYQENESKGSGGGEGLLGWSCSIAIHTASSTSGVTTLYCYFFSIQVGLDIFVRFNRDVEPMWACNLHEYYTDFKSRVQNVFRKYKERAKLLSE